MDKNAKNYKKKSVKKEEKTEEKINKNVKIKKKWGKIEDEIPKKKKN